MTRVTELSVRDFKAVEEADVRPGGVNLVVGRNNVGKTSLLEALHLALDPSSISRFDGNLDKVVREGAEEATIEVAVSGDDENEDRSVTVEGYDEETARRRLRKDVESELGKVTEGIEGDTPEAVSEVIEEASRVTDQWQKNRNLARDMCLVDNKIYLSKKYKFDTRFLISNMNLTKVVNESRSDDILEPGDLMTTADDLVQAGREMGDELTNTHFITDPGITDDTPDPSGDGNAIRRSRIEDFLIDNEIVDGLVDFSFGRLVFEDGDEREEVPYEFMGSGFKTLVGILWELYDRDEDTEVMLIEEPAVHMHPGYVNEFTQQLLQVARQEDVQLFLTTHREDLIESFFAPPTERAHGDYLREEFRVIQMTELLATELDYDQAETELDELNTDLRGI